MGEKKIIIIEAISKILLPVSLTAFVLLASSSGNFFCFGKDITLFVGFSFLWILFLAVVLEIAALLIRSKLRFSLRGSVSGFLKTFLLVFFFGAGIYLLFFATLSTSKPKARDARRAADLRQIATAQELFYQDTGRYADSQNEFVEKDYFSQTLRDILTGKEYADEDGTGLDGGDDDSMTWSAQVILENKHEHELCGGKRPTKIFFCDQSGCKYVSE